jgi:heme-degrading monooxygenase HmoA
VGVVYLRVTHVRTDPARLEEAIANFKERSVPGAQASPGYAGIVLMVDRGSGEAYAGTYWSDLAAMNAAERAGRDLRRQTAGATDAEVLDVDRFEMVLAERRRTTVPSFCRVNELYGDPSRAEAATEHLRDTVLPIVSGMEGFLSLASFVNRMTGRTMVSTTWASAEARAASAEAVAGPRRQAAQVAGTEDVLLHELEVVFAELK